MTEATIPAWVNADGIFDAEARSRFERAAENLRNVTATLEECAGEIARLRFLVDDRAPSYDDPYDDLRAWFPEYEAFDNARKRLMLLVELVCDGGNFFSFVELPDWYLRAIAEAGNGHFGLPEAFEPEYAARCADRLRQAGLSEYAEPYDRRAAEANAY